MKNKSQILFPQHQQMMQTMGANLQLARKRRKRRKLTAAQVAERANISRTTLYHLEQGDAKVSLGALFNVLRVLGLHKDFLKLAADDEMGRRLQDLDL